jgi:hypothetical protein
LSRIDSEINPYSYSYLILDEGIKNLSPRKDSFFKKNGAGKTG